MAPLCGVESRLIYREKERGREKDRERAQSIISWSEYTT